MRKQIHAFLFLGLLLVFLAVPFMAGWQMGERRAFARFRPHTDTLYIPRDTTITKTVIVEKWRVKKDTVRLANVGIPASGDSTAAADSALVEVPIEQKIYQDSLYTAWVSGFRPALDSIRLRQPTIVITQTVREPSAKVGHFGWGVTAGPSIIYSDRLRAGIGVTAGLTYRF